MFLVGAQIEQETMSLKHDYCTLFNFKIFQKAKFNAASLMLLDSIINQSIFEKKCHFPK